jgi:hypothetical protein
MERTMIVSIAASLIGVGAMSVQAQPKVHALPEVFVAACMDGGARLSAGQAALVNFEALPMSLRERLGKPASGQVWKLAGPGRAYLYILNYEPQRGVNPKICGLAADSMDLNAAADALETRVAGSVRSNRLRGTEWLVPRDGYMAVATTADDFNVVQINWLSAEQRAEALAAIRNLPQ